MSSTELDERLARIAPSGPPDPERFSAARAAVLQAMAAEPASEGTGPDGSLDEDRFRIDSVVPLDTARRRRNRRVAVAAAAASIVGLGAAVLTMLPDQSRFVPSSPVEECRAGVEGMFGRSADGLSWRTLVAEQTASGDLTLLVSNTGALAVACSRTVDDAGTTSTSTAWSGGLSTHTPNDGEVMPRGVVAGDWHVVWGLAAADVVSVMVRREYSESEDAPEPTFGGEVEARLTDDGYWWAAWQVNGSTGLGTTPSWTLTWELTDGSVQSMALDRAWTTEGDRIAGERREACLREPNTHRVDRPVVESKRDDMGVTMFATVISNTNRIKTCIQEADPPFASLLQIDSPDAGPAPADEAVTIAGGASAYAGALIGRAGSDVARVTARTVDGTELEADLGDGYWVAWSPELAGLDAAEDPWEGATVTWYLSDGTRGGSARWP